MAGYIFIIGIILIIGGFVWKMELSFFQKLPLKRKYQEALAYLNPEKNPEKEKEKLWRKNIIIFLGILLLAAIVGLLLEITEKKDSFIKELNRPEIGEGDMIYSLNVSVGETEKVLELTVSERKAKQEEAEKVFKQTYEKLREKILGENQTFEHIEADMELIDYIEETGCFLYWTSNNTDIISNIGEVNRTEIEKPVLVQLLAECNYGEYTKDYEFDVIVVPIDYDEKEVFFRNLYKQIEVLDKEQIMEPNFVLPEKIEGRTVLYQEKKTRQSQGFFILGAAVSLLIVLQQNQKLLKKSTEKENALLREYPEIVSKLTLLIGAGMTIRKAWEKIILDYKKKGKYHYAYEEMQITYYQIISGIPEGKAYTAFGKRCKIHSYRKLGSILEQNIKKGTMGLLEILTEEVEEALENRKALALRLGEEAGTKLLVPMVLLLGIVLTICIAPAVMSF